MKIITIIKDNCGSTKRSGTEVTGAANRLRLCHERLIAALKMKRIDITDQERKHLSSVNVHGDIDMWSQQLIDIIKKNKANDADIELAEKVYTELFDGLEGATINQ